MLTRANQKFAYAKKRLALCKAFLCSTDKKEWFIFELSRSLRARMKAGETRLVS